MIKICLLESEDIIRMDDWCRPLRIMYDGLQSDQISFTSLYSGTPSNNLKWARVSDILGDFWEGKTVESYNDEQNYWPYEFIRGTPPSTHILENERA